MYLKRAITNAISQSIQINPVTAIIGARQVGKSTLARHILKQYDNTLYIDIEKSSDRALLTEPELFFSLHKGKIICLDEIQLIPDIFSMLRSFVDENPTTKFLVLGSSSPSLLRQSAETLAGRIAYFELNPFLLNELNTHSDINHYRVKGGFPRSILSASYEQAFDWLENFIKTYLERDLRTFGYNLPPEALHRLWKMLAHLNGQNLNYSQLGNAMGLSHTTIKHYIDVLHHTFMLRLLPPFHTNIKKRLIKSPKLYIRDTGILHALLNINTFDDLYAHPAYGSSWEITVIENILAKFKKWDYAHYRTAKGNEIDLVLTKGNQVVAIEIKTSATPKLSKAFWTALDDIKATSAYVIAPVSRSYPLGNKVMVYNLKSFLQEKVEV